MSPMKYSKSLDSAVVLCALHSLASAVDVQHNFSNWERCPLSDDINIVYSLANGVGPASKIWVEDLLWWWQQEDAAINYKALTAQDIQNCDLASYPNLRIYINPGGNAYDQLVDLGPEGTKNIQKFVRRDQQMLGASAYVGFCAGGYLAAHDYLWEGTYEGTDYYDLEGNPPLSLFPHTLEGSIVDINDDQYADQMGSKFRAVNVSNGHMMLYYGGSTFGWNGSPDYASKPADAAASGVRWGAYDEDVEVLVYYTDFYGHFSPNIPAAWRYRTPTSTSTTASASPGGARYNTLLTSVHPEADNCTEAQDSDCPPAGTLPEPIILQNRAWLCSYINEAAATSFRVPAVPLQPLFNTTAPHTAYPAQTCYTRTREQHLKQSAQSTTSLVSNYSLPVFCADFEAAEGVVPAGLAADFQRNQSSFQAARPWNASYIAAWNGGVRYTDAFEGSGYAVDVPQTPSRLLNASIATRTFPSTSCAAESGVAGASVPLMLSYAYIVSNSAYTAVGDPGFMQVDLSEDSGVSWTRLAFHTDSDALDGADDAESDWKGGQSLWRTNHRMILLSTQARQEKESEGESEGESGGGGLLTLRFTCSAGPAVDSFCALDSLFVYCA